MRTIKVSEEVWQAIANQGKFGETEDDVLRRIFKLPSVSSAETMTPQENPTMRLPRVRHAKQRMSSFVKSTQLRIIFEDGTNESWTMPNRSDKDGIRAVRDKAVAFAKNHGATIGQIYAVKKALTDTGYHLTK